MGHHRLKQDCGSAEVIIVILQRMGHGFAHLGAGCEMDHTFDLFFFKQGIHLTAVADINVIKACLGMDCLTEASQ